MEGGRVKVRRRSAVWEGGDEGVWARGKVNVILKMYFR